MDGCLAACDARDHLAQLLHGDRASEQARAEHARVAALTGVGQLDGGRYQLAQVGEIQRLGHEIERAQLERAHGSFHVAVGGDHGNRNAGRILLNPFHEIETIAVREPHVGQAQIERLSLEQSLRRSDRAGNARSEVHPLQGDRQELANIRLVVDDQYGRFRHVYIVASEINSLRYASQRCGSLKTTLNTLPPSPRGSYNRTARFSWHSSRAMKSPS